jgi:acyl-CoA thioester hydrolase
VTIRPTVASENSSTLDTRVLYADTDQMGVVNHAMFFRWFEAGRAHYMRRRGSSYSAVEGRGLHLPVVEAHAHYLKPARYDEQLTITAWIGELGLAQLRFEYEISRDGEPLVRGYTRHATITPEGRPVRLPEDIRRSLGSAEAQTGAGTAGR